MTRDFRNPRAAKTLEQTNNVLIDLYDFVVPTYTKAADNYTTLKNAAREIVDCTGTATKTITFHSGAKQLQPVTVKRTGSGAVTLATEGSETIDGSASSSLATQGDKETFFYIEEDTDWRSFY